MEQYIEYVRKSQMDNDYEILSIEETLKRHKKILSDYAANNKLNVTVVLEEVVSAELLSARPMMMKCLELISTGEYAGILCMDIDRLSRGDSMDSGYITQVLKLNGCKIITPGKTYDLTNDNDEQFTDMKFMFSRYELKTINKRLVSGRQSSVNEGKYIGSTPPYGYIKYKLEGIKGYSLKINPEQARIVQLIYDLYTEQGLGYGKICTELDRLGIQASFPILRFDRHVIERILKNPVYIGKIRYKFKPMKRIMVDGQVKKKRTRNRDGYELHEGLHEPIISEEQWNKVQEARQNNLPVTANYELCNPFSRIAKCGKCGRTIVRRTTSSSPIKYRLSCPNRDCNLRSIFLTPFEEAVVKEMGQWLEEYKIQINNGTTANNTRYAELLADVEKQLADAKVQQEKICSFLEQGVYTVQMFQSRNDKLQADIDSLTITKNNLMEEIKKQEAKNPTEIIPKVQHLLDNYDVMSAQQKNDLWKEVLEKVELIAEPKQKDFHINLFPKI